jgi:hypothetical protein
MSRPKSEPGHQRDAQHVHHRARHRPAGDDHRRARGRGAHDGTTERTPQHERRVVEGQALGGEQAGERATSTAHHDRLAKLPQRRLAQRDVARQGREEHVGHERGFERERAAACA